MQATIYHSVMVCMCSFILSHAEVIFLVNATIASEIASQAILASLDGTLEEAAGQEDTSKERKRMKQYTVYYIIKANRREWLHKMEVEEAQNARELKR